jgi:hypothetical protein
MSPEPQSQRQDRRPICERVYRVLQRWSITRRFLLQSTMGKAIHYALEVRSLGLWRGVMHSPRHCDHPPLFEVQGRTLFTQS